MLMPVPVLFIKLLKNDYNDKLEFWTNSGLLSGIENEDDKKFITEQLDWAKKEILKQMDLKDRLSGVIFPVIRRIYDGIKDIKPLPIVSEHEIKSLMSYLEEQYNESYLAWEDSSTSFDPEKEFVVRFSNSIIEQLGGTPTILT